MAPFGLAGTLTGQTFKTGDATMRLLEDWGQFYPLDKTYMSGDNSVVEIIVGGVKMRYPSCYVLVTDMDDSVNCVVSGMNNVTINGPPTNGSTKNGNSKFKYFFNNLKKKKRSQYPILKYPRV